MDIKKTFFGLIKESLSDIDKQGSSKRFMTYLVFIVMTGLVGLVAFKVTLYDSVASMWKDLVMIFLVLIGAITSEKFTKRGMDAPQSALDDVDQDQEIHTQSDQPQK